MEHTAVSTPVTGSFSPEAFEARLSGQPAAAPAWWIARKRAAYAAFASLPLPVRTDEAWRFSSIKGLDLAGYAPAGPAARGLRIPGLGIRTAAELVFANNRLVSRTAPAAELAAKGVVVTTIAEALVRHGDLLKEHFMAQPQRLGSAKFAALHAAFLEDGAFIHIPRGVEIADPILVTHAVSGENAAVFPHTLVIAGENAKASVVDFFTQAGDPAPSARFLAAGANDILAGHGSRLTYAAVQDWPAQTLSFQLNSTVVRRDASVQSLNVHLGGRQARHESLSQLQAPGGFSEMLALSVANGTQEFDQRTLQMHQAPHTKSDLLYKNALLGSSRTIFSGLIIVDPDAQKTDAYQSNRNLMLSDSAEASSLPGLEIQANDVRCTHGATSSRIDPEQQFYLQSRGIPPKAAHELLISAFFEEVLGRVENLDLHAALMTRVRSKLGVV
jgi:Fe-S cluster assembly protein SufD